MAAVMTVALLAGCGNGAGAGTQESASTLVSVTDQADQSQETETGDVTEADGSTDPAQSEDSDEPADSAESPDSPDPAETPEKDSGQQIDEDGSYTTKEDVALYIHIYGKLPSNFITKKEAEKLGWTGGSLEPYAPGKSIGGSRFGNYEGILPEAKGRKYYECDIDTLGAKKRGAKRIIFSSDGLIYYTEDHYETFELLYGEE
jgi:hypothetical protein